MTRVLPWLLGATVLLSNGMAHASTIFDSIDNTGGDLNDGGDAVAPTAVGPIAASFSSASTQTLTTVSLEVSAANINDGGSLNVVLMSDNNGDPPYQTTSGITTFTGTTLLATLLDSSLSATPSLVTINTSVALGVGTYWIGLETPLSDDTYSSAAWWWTYTDASTAIGLDFNTNGLFSFPDSAGPYEMIVETSTTTAESAPEPGTFAILGGGLAGLGYMRRRTANKV